ncbi:hypothetical protein A9174_35725 (plasmid) [Mesorhizobium loti NZP2037]|nr:hypothetical protein A9174_35725 [Mesorhizobium loti NZP2037]
MRTVEGSTAVTTALVQFEIDRPLTELSHMIGAGAAQQAWPRSRLALLNLREASGPYLYARLRRMVVIAAARTKISPTNKDEMP